MISNKIFRRPVKVIKLGDVYLVLAKWKINVGDRVIDHEAFKNGYTDVLFTCEDVLDEENMNQEGNGYLKIISISDENTAFLFNDGPPHDHNYDYQNGYIEPILGNAYDYIIDSGGDCEMEVEVDEFGLDVLGPQFVYGNSIVLYTKSK